MKANPYPIDAPVFCKNCANMRLVEYDADKIEANMRCTANIKWITDSFVDERGHWEKKLPWCHNNDGKCENYIPRGTK